jgi:hypothetical protein
MTELEQLEKILEGFQGLIDKINSWGIQPKGIQNHLDPIKSYFSLLIEMGTMLKKLIKSIGPEEIKKRLGNDSIRQDLLKWARALKKGEIGLQDWEAIINKDSKKNH